MNELRGKFVGALATRTLLFGDLPATVPQPRPGQVMATLDASNLVVLTNDGMVSIDIDPIVKHAMTSLAMDAKSAAGVDNAS